MTISPDPSSEPGRWDRLFAVLRQIDTGIEDVYRRLGHHQMRPRFAAPLLRLGHEGAMTITALAASLGRTHSAVSQTVDAMRRAGLVVTAVGTDARTRLIELSSDGQRLLPLVEHEWRATEAAVAELDDALSLSLDAIACELEAALARRSVTDRLQTHLDAAAHEP
ncbi:MAG: MarR family transcriptional regulator [Microbacterium sp.]